MTQPEARTHQDSVFVAADPDAVYDVVSDVTRTGEWSPVCASCWWDDEAEAGRVGAWFTGHNETSDRTWETRSQVVVAERGQEFAWVVGNGFVRWGFLLETEGEGTQLTETWAFLPEGLAMFADKYGDRAPDEIDDRTRQAHAGIPTTLAAIKRIVATA